MAIARQGEGAGAAVAALASQVHPVFMLPPVAVSLFGAILTVSPEPAVAGLHFLAIFSAMFVAHVKDGYIDFHVRGEDDDHPLTVGGCRLGIAIGTAGFVVAVVGLWLVSNPLAVALTLPGYAIGYLHAPTLDTTPVTATVGYPMGIALALLGGYAAQTGTLTLQPLALAGVFLVLLSGVKVIDDSTDIEFDRAFGKETVAVRLGPRWARQLGFGLMATGGGAVLALTGLDVIPEGAVLAVFVFGAVAAIAVDAPPKQATMMLVRGAYLFLAVLVVAVWYQPLAGSPWAGADVLGSYLYLASEVGFGLIAFALLWRVGALAKATKTIALLYPVAYLWDWYSLEVGIFAILRHTGIELAGIPLEEHLFMIVVPAFVIGVHEVREDMTDPRN